MVTELSVLCLSVRSGGQARAQLEKAEVLSVLGQDSIGQLHFPSCKCLMAQRKFEPDKYGKCVTLIGYN